MAAKGICVDGMPVDEKVKNFQDDRKNDDFLMVQQYYDDYKEYWFNKVSELIDRDEFEQEW